MKVALTDKFCERAKAGEWFDEKATGLALRVGKNRKTWQLHFTRDGVRGRDTIGHYPALSLAAARRVALEGKPALEETGVIAKGKTFEGVVDLFITHYAKPRQRTWDQTERILKVNCSPWLARPIAEITKADARTLLRGFVDDGYPYKATVTRAWLKKLFRWAAEEDHVETSIMEAVSIEIEKRKRQRVYSPEEIKATWLAAGKLPLEDGAFVRLAILLAPRQTSLACATRADVSEGLWTVPFELTKSRKTAEARTYLVPLPPQAAALFASLAKSGPLFPSLPIRVTRSGSRVFYGDELRRALIRLGAPKDFRFHAWRHTIATFLENAGHSKWERGLVLNHAEGGVTAGYSHGYPLEAKRKLLAKWADHVASIVG